MTNDILPYFRSAEEAHADAVAADACDPNEVPQFVDAAPTPPTGMPPNGMVPPTPGVDEYLQCAIEVIEMVVMLGCMYAPKLITIFTDAAKSRIAAALGDVMRKYGWTTTAMPVELKLALALLPIARPAYEIIREQYRADQEAARLAAAAAIQKAQESAQQQPLPALVPMPEPVAA